MKTRAQLIRKAADDVAALAADLMLIAAQTPDDQAEVTVKLDGIVSVVNELDSALSGAGVQ